MRLSKYNFHFILLLLLFHIFFPYFHHKIKMHIYMCETWTKIYVMGPMTSYMQLCSPKVSKVDFSQHAFAFNSAALIHLGPFLNSLLSERHAYKSQMLKYACYNICFFFFAHDVLFSYKSPFILGRSLISYCCLALVWQIPMFNHLEDDIDPYINVFLSLLLK